MNSTGTRGSRALEASGPRSCSATITTSRTRKRRSSWHAGRHGQDARPPRQAEAQGGARRLGARQESDDDHRPHCARTVALTTSDDDWLDAALAADAREHGTSYLDDRASLPA